MSQRKSSISLPQVDLSGEDPPVLSLISVGEENIKVSLRMRGLLAHERREVWKLQDKSITCLEDRAKSNRTAPVFTYDHVYGPDVTSTDHIYEEVGSPLVDAVMEGYNGTIFAYGQTSSGKTHTMMGVDGNPGMIPNAIQHVFEAIRMTPEREYLLRVSYMEIYNEVLNDLLRSDGSNLNIREDRKKGGLQIDGLKEEIVLSPEHVMQIINVGEAQRHVAATDLNSMSSRSPPSLG